MEEKYDSKKDVMIHIKKIRDLLTKIIIDLEERSVNHDKSKLEDFEKSCYDKYIPLIKKAKFGSDEYEDIKEKMGEGLKHHYENNRHHPEHFTNTVCSKCGVRYYPDDINHKCGCGGTVIEKPDISQMTLIDLTEMLVDWVSVTSNIDESIETLQLKYGFRNELKSILKNTVSYYFD